jgi:hypothetical protein
VYAGFDLFRFPQNLQLGWFDAFRFVNDAVARFRRERIDGVFSNNEYFGALIAAVVAEKLGLPGNNPRVVLTAQHKFYARKAYAAIAPEAGARFCRVPLLDWRPRRISVRLPVLHQAGKGHVLGARTARRHLSPSSSAICASGRSRKYVIKRLVKAVQRSCCPWYTDFRRSTPIT